MIVILLIIIIIKVTMKITVLGQTIKITTVSNNLNQLSPGVFVKEFAIFCVLKI